jgi:hypothetical protein
MGQAKDGLVIGAALASTTSYALTHSWSKHTAAGSGQVSTPLMSATCTSSPAAWHWYHCFLTCTHTPLAASSHGYSIRHAHP